MQNVISSLPVDILLSPTTKHPPISQVTDLIGIELEQSSDSADYVTQTYEPSDRLARAVSKPHVRQFHSLDYPDLSALRRCAKCVLPATFPGLTFDSEGICSECRKHKNASLRPLSELKTELSNQVGGDRKVLVGLSGGRDSCYGLHVLKNELGFTPVAFTYDWGMVTDIARRNIANICGELGVEHLIVSPNISKKLRNIRLNISAWLARPSLQMIPIFMAGDKYFYYFAHRLRKSLDIKSFLFCAGNRLETTNFKTRFGLNINSPDSGILTDLSVFDRFKLFSGYTVQCALNPRYLNASLSDTVGAFYSSYVLRDDYLYLYHFFPWEERAVEETLVRLYGWEGATPTTSGWRVGDGTAAFYNYIYYVVAGFTEHDTFRSNQIREGAITRETALRRVEAENQPRWEMLDWYAARVGFNLADSLRVIHAMPKLYS